MSNLYKDAEALVSKMTIEEVASQLKFNADAVERLGIPEYNWWNEALHGVARAGIATVFPQAIGMAATFDDELLHEEAKVIATEGRAKYNAQSKEGDRDIYKGLTFWSPNINIFRDARWGRGHETYGEDPFLTSRMGVAFVKGLQGDENYPECDTIKVAACAKHFAVHSGPEGDRHHFDAIASKKDMEETYLPAFEACVKEGKVEAVMGAYNRTNGEPCCGHKELMVDTLRGKWGFNGHFVSDCWAIKDFHENHKITNTPAESAALALKMGCDLNCGVTYLCILAALKEKKVTEAQVRQACVRVMATRMKLGILPRTDEEALARTKVYDEIGYLENDTPESRALALKTAEESLVLLKNNGVLPLKEGEYNVIGVVGPTADIRSVLEGNYCGTASEYVTNLEGIRRTTKSRIIYSEGCHLYNDEVSNLAKHDDRMGEALSVVRNSDVVVLCLGLDASIEGEEGDARNFSDCGDKKSLLLPPSQLRLAKNVIEAAKEQNKKVIAVINAGSALDISYLDENADAVLDCWYSGEQGGLAMARALFGLVNPSGKLPLTFYKDGTQPDFKDYAMKNRTYRYFKGTPLYPFGYGLSYTSFETKLSLEHAAGIPEGECEYMNYQKDLVNVHAKIKNTGKVEGTKTLLLYIDKKPLDKKENGLNKDFSSKLDENNQPIKSLCAFKRITLMPGEEKEIVIPVKAYEFTTVLEDGTRALLKGSYIIATDDANAPIDITE